MLTEPNAKTKESTKTAEPLNPISDTSKVAATPTPVLVTGLALIGRLYPPLADVAGALAFYEPSGPLEFDDRGSAFEAINVEYPRLGQAIQAFVSAHVIPGESVSKTLEDACRGMLGMPPMTDAEEVAWIHRHDVKPVVRPDEPDKPAKADDSAPFLTKPLQSA